MLESRPGAVGRGLPDGRGVGPARMPTRARPMSRRLRAGPPPPSPTPPPPLLEDMRLRGRGYPWETRCAAPCTAADCDGFPAGTVDGSDVIVSRSGNASDHAFRTFSWVGACVVCRGLGDAGGKCRGCAATWLR